MPAPPRRPAALVGKVFPGRYAITRGLLTKSDLRLVLHVTAHRLRADFDGVLAEIRAALNTRRPR